MVKEVVELVTERQPGVEASTAIVEGAPARTLRDQAAGAAGAAEIVLGSRGAGALAGVLVGSVSTHVAGHARCPVVVVRPEQDSQSGEVVVGLDDTPASDPALEYAFRQAELRDTTLRALHAWEAPVHLYAPQVAYDPDDITSARTEAATARLDRFRLAHPRVKVVEDIRNANPAEALTDASESAVMVVVGSHGRGGLRSALLGSVGHGVLHRAHCAVAVVRA
jgi:nucleotide-binding universal stress UspA family protein